MSVKPIPDGYTTITPYLIVKGAADAIDFYQRAFGAVELMKFDGPGGSVMHAELQIGNARFMVADEFPEMNALAPQSPGSSGVSILLYVENVDEVVATALEAGAKAQRDLEDQFYGDRTATLEDPFGHVWTVATHIEDISDDEMQRRIEEMMHS